MSETLYRYRDAQGVEHLVQGLEEVPAAYAGMAAPVEGGVPVRDPTLSERAQDEVELRTLQAEGAVKDALARAEKGALGARAGTALSVPSLLLGGAAVLVAVLALYARRYRWARPVAGAVVAALLSAAVYMTVLRRGVVDVTTAPGRAAPLDPVSQAREAARALERAEAEKARALEALERSPP